MDISRSSFHSRERLPILWLLYCQISLVVPCSFLCQLCCNYEKLEYFCCCSLCKRLMPTLPTLCNYEKLKCFSYCSLCKRLMPTLPTLCNYEKLKCFSYFSLCKHLMPTLPTLCNYEKTQMFI